MAKYVATIYYTGQVDGEGETEEEAIENARIELPFNYDTEDITVEKCDEEESHDKS
ncbi:MAG: hypothetical protein ACI4RK_09020 [Oscillospiraceae bacterium]